MAADTHCHTPFGHFHLRRLPYRRDEPLQAWCAADLLLLEEVHRIGGGDGRGILVVNDEQGMLCTALAPRALWSDSALAAMAMRRNTEDNQRPAVPVYWSTSAPPPGNRLIVLRIPKQLPYLEYQLATLAGAAVPGTVVLAAGMDKHLSPRVAQLLELYIGPTERHRGRQKARLFSSVRDDRSGPSPAPLAHYHCPAAGGELEALPNVFSPDRLDGGSRLLLAQLSRLSPASHLLDLACGNGVLGLAGFRQGLAPTVTFADESAMAIASARHNASRLFPGSGAFAFHHDDGLANYQGPPADLILCNPPFHLGHAVEEFAGRRLLLQCARHLPAGGRLCLVANQHLGYLPVLRRHFTRVDQLGRDRRFIVWLAQRR